MSHLHLAAPEILDTLRQEYRHEVDSTEQALRKLAVSRVQLRNQELHRLRRHLLVIERDQVMQAFQQGALGSASRDRLLADVDARLVRMEAGGDPAGALPEGDNMAGAS